MTFLLTDVVGSTRLWDTAAAAMSAALERHDSLVAEVVAAHGGTLVKARGEGDATFSVFARATDAVTAAGALRQALRAEPWPDGAAITVRTAVHTGEAVERGGDYYGGTVNRAARLRGLAGPGQVVLSDTTAGLVVDHLADGSRLVSLGTHVLEGLSRPELVHELVGPGDEGGPPARPGPASVGRLTHRILGGFEVRAAGVPVDLGPPKQRAVLAVLLLEAGRVVPAERLVELLWGDAPRSLASLQTYVSNLRRALEPDRRPRDAARVLVTEPPGYRLVVERDDVDALRFEDLVASGKARLRDGDAAGAAAVLHEALGLWAGPPLPELAGEAFVVSAAARLEGLRGTALGLLAEARLQLGDHHGAVALLEGPVAEHPLDERLHSLLALALYRSGRQADALRVVDRVRRALADTAGLEPTPALRALERDLLAHAPELDWRAPAGPAAATSAVPPPQATGAARPAPPGAGGAAVPDRAAGGAFVGRGAELERLAALLDDAATGAGGVAVVVGEPGIGKTRLVEELSVLARARGFVAAWARCPEGGAVPPFWPATQLALRVREAGAVDAELVPPEPDAPAPPATLFALYEAVVQALRSPSTPLLLVVDDLQWADADSLRLLAHVAGELRTTPALVVVTVRPLGEDSEPALLDCLGALARAPGALHLALAGLPPAAVAEWLGRRTDVAVPPQVAALVHERTGGHPLFVKELSELLAAEGRLGDAGAVAAGRTIPPGVHFVVRRRVTRLPPATQHLLSVASVVGRSFDLDVVAAVADEPLDAALDAVAPALAAGLIDEDPGGGFRFSHALVADALAAEINPARRARLHAATARALAARTGPVLGPRAALVAHHAHAGALAGTAELAVRASSEAARIAASRLGFEDAAAHWARAVEALQLADPADQRTRTELLCELARARFKADLVDDAAEAAVDAVELAEAAGDPAGMARAATLLANPHVWPNRAYGEVDARAVAALERTIAVLDPADLATRAAVLSALANELAHGDRARLDRVRGEAVAVARASGDPAVLATALVGASGPLEASRHAERLAMGEEVLALAAAHPLAPEVELAARLQLALARSEGADLDAAVDHASACLALADRIGGGPVRAQLGWFRASIAIARGRYDEALELGREAAEVYVRTRRSDAELIELSVVAAVAGDRGTLEAHAPRLAAAGVGSPGYARITAELTAWLTTEAGWREAGAAALAGVDPRVPFRDDYTMLCAATMGLHVRAELGDVEGAAAVMAQLEPYSGRWALLGTAGCNGGLVDLALARGAALLGDRDRARALFERAVAGHERLRTPAWLARSLVHQGRFLCATGGAADDAHGRQALARAAALARAHGLGYVARQVGEAVARAGADART